MDLVKAENVSVPFQGMAAMPLLRQLGLLIGLAASIALGVAIVLWMQTPNYTRLPGQLSGQTLNDVISVLEKNNIRYNVDPGTGSVMVDSTKVNEAKLKLASENLSLSSGHGFEMIEKDQGFGTSSFLQKARYKRALEGELARTITSMRSIQSARVHLALPKDSAFIRNKREASASVFINMVPGHSIEKNQIAAISNLVASSISSLKTSQVTIVDDRGKLLSNAESEDMMGLTTSQLDYTRNIEKTFVSRIERMLSPIVGLGNVRAQVTAEVDFTQTESTQETFNPDLPAVRSEQSSEEQSQGASQGGIPGALSNQPPANATAPQQVNQQATATTQQGSKRTSRRSTKNYELDKTISHTRNRAGAIKHLSVAVVLNNKASTQKPKAGKEAKSLPYTQQELQRITTLVRETVGFNVLRGDSVNVINVPFSKVEIVPLPEVAIYEQAWVWDVVKQVLGGLAVLFMIFGILKPVMRNLAIAPPIKKIISESGEELDEDQLSLSGADKRKRLAKVASYEENLQMAQSLATQEPKRVVQVVKNWMNE
ncbi:MAG: flagellar basal-body MS-ring/collar protein FliF [Gammaproteobacteria bacterium]|nr:MAG: flagellar basal-body MS-ring/collar protein FliF [Gammaproteobacteria bacterium]